MLMNMPVLFATDWPGLIAFLLVYALLAVVPLLLLIWLLYCLLSLPMRRQERARFFLDLLSTIIREGKPLEQTLIEISNSRDKAPGWRFHLVAGYLERGLRLGEALKKVPRFLPPQVTAILHAGEEMQDLRKVLPVCNYLVKDAQSNVRGAVSYLIVIAFALSPFSLSVMNTLAVLVLPKFEEIIWGMQSNAADPQIDQSSFEFLRKGIGWLMLAQAILFAGLLIAAIIYVGGPRLVHWIQSRRLPWVDWVAWHVPWKRRRMHRNFSMMLAILLDNGVPEATALRLAAESTANQIFLNRAAKAQAALASGTRLTDAVASLDDTGEFRWRLTNAIHAHGGFLSALTGWHESLDAKAFQQEQAAAHAVTTGLVIANGIIVALVATGIFGALIAILNAGVLW